MHTLKKIQIMSIVRQNLYSEVSAPSKSKDIEDELSNIERGGRLLPLIEQNTISRITEINDNEINLW